VLSVATIDTLSVIVCCPGREPVTDAVTRIPEAHVSMRAGFDNSRLIGEDDGLDAVAEA
jgi:hypothetical protein